MLHSVADAQTLDSKGRIQRHKDMVALGADPFGGRLGQRYIGLEGL